MVVEYLRYTIPASAADQFERAYQRAAQILAADPHCLAYELARGVEEPEHFIVRIEWDSIDGHEQGFRRSSHFMEFFGYVRPFFANIAEMKHYTVQQDGFSGARATGSS